MAYKPPFSTSSTSSSTSKQDRSWQPYSKQDERWQPLSKNQRRKKNKRNPPQQSTFLPPTVADLIVPAQPQPSTFPEHEDDNYLTTWMNTYNPHLTNRISVSNLAINLIIMAISTIGVRNEDLEQALLPLNQKNIRYFLIQFINLSKTIAAYFSRNFQNMRASFL